MPDRVSPVSITPHLLPLPTQPQLHPISPLSARLPAGKHKTLRLHLFSKSRDAPGQAEGGPPRRTVVSRPPWPWPQSSPQTGIKSEQTEYFPKLLYRRAPMNGFKGLLATLLRQQQLYWSCPLGDPTWRAGRWSQINFGRWLPLCSTRPMVASRNTVQPEMGNRIVLKGKAVKACFYRYCRGVFVWLLIHGVEMPSLVEAN